MNVVNIASSLVEMARRQPDTPALLEPHPHGRGPQDARRLTYRQLDEESDRLARGLSRMGLRLGTRTVLMVPPCAEFFALTFALFKLGCVVVLIDPGMGIRNLGVCLAEAEPEAFLGVPKAQLARVFLRWGRKSIRHIVTVNSLVNWWGWSLERVRRRGEQGEPVLARTTADETAAILFTSGSTGVAKGVVYTHGIFTAQVEALRRIYDIEPGEVDLATFPLFGLFGPALGMTCVIPEMDFTRPGRVNPRNIVEPVWEHKVTNLFGSPALLRRVMWSGPLVPLRRVISAGAPVSPKVIRQVAAQLRPGVQVHTPYGATEAMPVATIGSDEILGETGSLTALGKGACVGRPVEAMLVRIILISDEPMPTWSDDLELTRGEVGEIAVSGPVVTRSYFNRPQSTALHKIHDGDRLWHRMGDVGYLDDSGRVWFCGRKSHRVVTPSATYFTIPVEGVFNAHPAVHRTALIGVTRDGVVEPELCVELEAKRPDLDALRRELAELGASQDHTRPIRRFHFHPSFPVDVRHNAKIFREKLAAWAAKQRGGLVP